MIIDVYEYFFDLYLIFIFEIIGYDLIRYFNSRKFQRIIEHLDIKFNRLRLVCVNVCGENLKLMLLFSVERRSVASKNVMGESETVWQSFLAVVQ